MSEIALHPRQLPIAPARSSPAIGKQIGAVALLTTAIVLPPVPEIIRVVLLGVALALVGLLRPGIGMLFAVVLTVVDGAIRKWWMPTTSGYVYLEKDILLLFCYLGAFRLGWWKLRRGAEYAWFEIAWAFLALIIAVELLLMRSDEAYIALNGARMYLLYMPLSWLLPEYLSVMSLSSLRKALMVATLTLIPMAALATIQFQLPQDATVNKYATGTSSDVALFGEEKSVRATGTFSFISGFTDFVNFAGAITAGLLLAGVGSTVVPLAMICAFWCGVCSGSRLSAIWLLTQTVVTIFLSVSDMRIRRGVRLIIILVVVGYGLGLLGTRFGAIGALEHRAQSADDTWDRVRGTFERPIHSLTVTNAFGEGLGTTYQQLLVRNVLVTSALERYDEVADDRIMVELGIGGMLVEMVWRVFSVVVCFRFFRAARNLQVRALLAALLAYQLMFIWSYPLYDSVASIYYSASLALALSLRRIDQAIALDAA